MRVLQTRTVLIVLLGVVSGVGTSRAGEGVKPIDICQTLTVRDRSSFILLRDLFSAGQDCLVVNANNVTIDLNGFAIIGSGTGRGITASSSLHGVTIRNGTVRGFATGIALAGTGNLIEHVRIAANTDTGLVLGAGSLAHHVVVQDNFQAGVVLSTACTFRDGIVQANGNSPTSRGLAAGPGSTVTGNTVWRNFGAGIFSGSGSTVAGNTVLDTSGVGISVICPSNVLHNTATTNSAGNLLLGGPGCNSVNNVAP